MSEYENNSIFWVETEKIGANPFQPRRDFEPGALDDLADSIRQYGVLQPLVVTRREDQTDNGGFSVYYELIAGERRLRAARLAGLNQVPVIIRKETSNKIKLELAIIENLQREDLNPIDRALAFEQLYKDFELTHAEIGKRMGKSRVYVSNSLRLLALPENIKQGLMSGRITEGHTRPLLMLGDKPDEQQTLFTEIMMKKMSVRESEKIARSIAQDKVRKKEFIIDPRIRSFEKRLSENLGTRVQIAPGEKGGKITIDYFTLKDLEGILKAVNKVEYTEGENMMDRYMNEQDQNAAEHVLSSTGPIDFITDQKQVTETTSENGINLEKLAKEEIVSDNESYFDKEQFTKSEFSLQEKKETNQLLSENTESNFFLKPLPQINTLTAYQREANQEITPLIKSLPEFQHNQDQEITEYHTEITEPEKKEIINTIQPVQIPTAQVANDDEPRFNQNSFHITEQSVQQVNDYIDPDFFADNDTNFYNNTNGNNSFQNAQNNTAVNQGYTQVQQQQYANPQYQAPYQNNYPQQNYQQRPQPKKGFLGNLFG